MYLNQVFELSMVLDNENFHKVLSRAGYLEENEGEYIDRTLAHKGIIVTYQNSQYKKKVRLIVNPRLVIKCDDFDSDKFIRKLKKYIEEYFYFRYQIKDFGISRITITKDIDVGNSKNVKSYIKVLRRIGKVKGFSATRYDCFDDNNSFCLEGNSNGIEFMLYDLKDIFKNQLMRENSREKCRLALKKSEGILRVEVRLTKAKEIRNYTDASDVCAQLVDLSTRCQDIFLGVFIKVIPFGDYYKKDAAVEIIRKEVRDSTIKRKMLRLLALIPEKKSLYLAQKTMKCRNLEKVMDMFARINVSPVTISKRYDVKYMRGIYFYLEN